MLFKLARQSLLNRKYSVLLTLFSLMVSVSVLISVEHIRSQAKDSFNRTISGVDLIVGARTSQLNLLLYSVFRIGAATANISWEGYQKLNKNKQVAWTIPVSLGDSHRGYRVLGTTDAYFEHYKFGNKHALTFAQGGEFGNAFEVVLGAEVARELDYALGTELILSHGLGNVSFTKHDKATFIVSGILAPTGTPVDKTVHVTLSGLEAVHLAPAQLQAYQNSVDSNGQYPVLKPKSITAAFVGLKSKFATFAIQRNINTDKSEALIAVLPGVAIAELWQMLGNVENLLLVISFLVLLSSLLGLATMLLASIRERKQEMTLLRAIGAGPFVMFCLIQLEALLIAILAILSAFGVVFLTLSMTASWLVSQYGLFISTNPISDNSLMMAAVVLGLTVVIACIPAIQGYLNSKRTQLAN